MDTLILKVHRAQSVAYVLLQNGSLYIKERFKMIKYILIIIIIIIIIIIVIILKILNFKILIIKKLNKNKKIKNFLKIF